MTYGRACGELWREPYCMYITYTWGIWLGTCQKPLPTPWGTLSETGFGAFVNLLGMGGWAKGCPILPRNLSYHWRPQTLQERACKPAGRPVKGKGQECLGSSKRHQTDMLQSCDTKRGIALAKQPFDPLKVCAGPIHFIHLRKLTVFCLHGLFNKIQQHRPQVKLHRHRPQIWKSWYGHLFCPDNGPHKLEIKRGRFAEKNFPGH